MQKYVGKRKYTLTKRRPADPANACTEVAPFKVSPNHLKRYDQLGRTSQKTVREKGRNAFVRALNVCEAEEQKQKALEIEQTYQQYQEEKAIEQVFGSYHKERSEV